MASRVQWDADSKSDNNGMTRNVSVIYREQMSINALLGIFPGQLKPFSSSR